MTFRNCSVPVGSLIALAVFAIPALAQQTSTFTTIDVPGATGTVPIFINPAGVIVGQYVDWNGATHGFLRNADGAITTFDAPGAGTDSGEGTRPWSINPAGEVTGWFTDSAGLTHGFVRASDGTFKSFNAPGAGIPSGMPCSPPVICSNGTQAASINAAGEVSGQYVDTSGVFHGFVRSPDGTISTFNASGQGSASGQGTYATTGDGLSLPGVMIGGYADARYDFHGLIRARDGTLTTFDPAGSMFTDPAGINPEGVIIGLYAGASGTYHGFIRSPGGEITNFDLPGAGADAGQGTEPLNINSAGDFTGTYIDGNGVNHGFLRLKDGTVSTFDAPGAGTGSGQGTTPFCNDPANAIIGYYVDANGVYHGFLRK